MIALWLEFQPRHPRAFTVDLGTHLNALVFSVLSAIDPEQAAHIHNQQRRKPFTVSTLLDARRRPTTRLQTGQPHLVRLTLFDPALAQAVARRFLLEYPPPLRLAEADLDLMSVSVDPDAPLQGRATYRQLLDSPVPRRFTLRFWSPTALREKGHNLPLPDPRGLFSGYLHRWNSFAPEPLPEELVTQAVERGELLLTRHRIRTEVLRLPAAPQVGFVGTVEFQVKPGPAAAALAALARFAAYSGSGYHATQGMGQTQFLTQEGSPGRDASQADRQPKGGERHAGVSA